MGLLTSISAFAAPLTVDSVNATGAAENSYFLGKVGIGTTTPDYSAALDIVSTTKGLLIPRMDSTARKAISDPAIGLMVFDSTTNSFWFHSGAAWREIAMISTPT